MSAKKQELELPYIGINVERLPQIVDVVLNSKIKSRSGLRDIYARKFQCSQKTAKEYINSLINLNVLKKDGLDRFAIKHEPNSELSELLNIFYAKDHWPSLLEFLVSTNPVFEVLREIVFKINPIANKMTMTGLKASVQELMSKKKIVGSLNRRQTIEAFLRIILRNAIDYLRGHKLSLVWLGYRISDIRKIRAVSIGAERSPDVKSQFERQKMISSFGDIKELPCKYSRIIERYADDLFNMVSEVKRVIKPNGRAVFVIGNSCLHGVFIKNSSALAKAAALSGLHLVSEHERELLASSRYLPMPSDKASALGKRMRTECILVLVHKRYM